MVVSFETVKIFILKMNIAADMRTYYIYIIQYAWFEPWTPSSAIYCATIPYNLLKGLLRITLTLMSLKWPYIYVDNDHVWKPLNM